MVYLTAAAVDIAVTLVLGALGVGGAWWLRRSSSLSIRNLYPAAALSVLLVGGAVTVRWWTGVLVLMPVCAPWVGAVAAGRRCRLLRHLAGEPIRVFTKVKFEARPAEGKGSEGFRGSERDW